MTAGHDPIEVADTRQHLHASRRAGALEQLARLVGWHQSISRAVHQQHRAGSQTRDLVLGPELDQRLGRFERELTAHLGEFAIHALEERLSLGVRQHDLEWMHTAGLARPHPPRAIRGDAGQELVPFPVATQATQPALAIARAGNGDHGPHA